MIEAIWGGLLVVIAVAGVIIALADRTSGWRRTVKGDLVGRINIGGREYTGDNISIVKDRIYVDGREVTADYTTPLPRIMEIHVIEGTIGYLTTDGSVTCNDVQGDVDAGGSVTCQAVGGDVDAGGSVSCNDVRGSVDAGGSINCGKVGGSVDAGGSVRIG